MQLIKDLYPVKKKKIKIQRNKSKYIDNCIEILNNVKQNL